MNTLIPLLISFLKIGLCSIGGGYATIPLIQEQVVDIHHWLNLQEFTDIITISQMTPGPLAINTSTFVGMKLGGTLGAMTATFGCIISGFFISITLFHFFDKFKEVRLSQDILKGLRSVSIGLIASAAMTMLFLAFRPLSVESAANIAAIGIFSVVFFLLRKYQLNPIIAMVISGIIGYFFY